MSVNVAIYLPSLEGGGAERIAVTIANSIAERGLHVDLVLANAIGPYLKDVAQNVRVVNLKANRVIASLPALVSYLRRERPQAMLSLLNHANVIAVIARQLSRVKLRLIISERSLVLKPKLPRRSLSSQLILSLMRWFYPKADGVIAISKGVADNLAKSITMPKNKITVIYNPAVTQELFNKAQAPLKHAWLDDVKLPVIIGVGRLTKAKDFPTLIRAFAKVREQHDCRLVILGEGELRSELEKLVQELNIRDHVLLPGFIDNPFAWMSRAELFVCSSAWEGFGNVLVEAMACGTPVVSTNCPSGPSEILEGGKWGALVPVGDTEALADRILEAINSPTKIDVVERAMEFTPNLIVEQYLQALYPRKEVQ